MAERLRIGLLLDGELAPAWVVQVIDRLAAAESLDIQLVLTSEGVAPTRPEDVGDWDGGSAALAWTIWLNVERLFRGRATTSFALRALPERIRSVTRLRIPADAVPSAASMSMLRHLRELSLDVVLQFGQPEWGASLCGVSRFGVWRIRVGDTQRSRRGPPGFWEVVNGEGTTVVGIEMLTPESAHGRVLADGAFTSTPRSVLDNRSALHGVAAKLLLRELESLYRRGADAWAARLDALHASVVPSVTSASLRVPSVVDAAWGAVKVLGRRVLGRMRGQFMQQQWLLMYSFEGGNEPDTRLEHFKQILPPRGVSWADPFVVQRGARRFVFFEEKRHSQPRGVIACLELRADGGWTEPRQVLARPYHLSYPNVFEHDGQWYMLPETHESRQVELYRALEFPWRWERLRTMLDDVELADPTLWHHDNRWWLFGTVRAVGEQLLQDALYLYWSDDLLEGVWTPHADNPVVLDATSARPAGRMWSHEGKVYRPSQDCTTRYGYALRVNALEELTTDAYRERCVRRVVPDAACNLIGVHTISFAHGVTVMDALRWGWR